MKGAGDTPTQRQRRQMPAQILHARINSSTQTTLSLSHSLSRSLSQNEVTAMCIYFSTHDLATTRNIGSQHMAKHPTYLGRS